MPDRIFYFLRLFPRALDKKFSSYLPTCTMKIHGDFGIIVVASSSYSGRKPWKLIERVWFFDSSKSQEKNKTFGWNPTGSPAPRSFSSHSVNSEFTGKFGLSYYITHRENLSVSRYFYRRRGGEEDFFIFCILRESKYSEYVRITTPVTHTLLKSSRIV